MWGKRPSNHYLNLLPLISIFQIQKLLLASMLISCPQLNSHRSLNAKCIFLHLHISAFCQKQGLGFEARLNISSYGLSGYALSRRLSHWGVLLYIKLKTAPAGHLYYLLQHASLGALLAIAEIVYCFFHFSFFFFFWQGEGRIGEATEASGFAKISTGYHKIK